MSELCFNNKYLLNLSAFTDADLPLPYEGAYYVEPEYRLVARRKNRIPSVIMNQPDHSLRRMNDK
jgi:hypothetical protein